MKEELKEKVVKVCEALYNKKALDIKAIYVADKTIIADWLVICSGRSTAQVKTLCDEIEEKAPEFGLELCRKEGYAPGRWIVLDFSSILVHIFYPEEREYYNLERLWMDNPAECIEYSREQGENE